MCLQFTLSSYFQCRLLSVTSPVTEWLSSGPISGVFLHNPSFVAQLVSAWPSVREVPSSIPGNTTSFSFNFSPLHTCQLSRIIWESPEYGIDLPLSRTGHHISRIKSSLELFCALLLEIQPIFSSKKNFLFVVRFLGHFCTYLVTDKDNFWLANILIVCTSCKTSYNVLSHSHWGLGQFVGGWGRGPLKFRRE